MGRGERRFDGSRRLAVPHMEQRVCGSSCGPSNRIAVDPPVELGLQELEHIKRTAHGPAAVHLAIVAVFEAELHDDGVAFLVMVVPDDEHATRGDVVRFP